jgi:hypothetical protein
MGGHRDNPAWLRSRTHGSAPRQAGAARHVLACRAVYESVPFSVRRRLHHRAARALRGVRLGWPGRTVWPISAHRRWLEQAAATVASATIPRADRLELTVSTRPPICSPLILFRSHTPSVRLERQPGKDASADRR